jgi:uncharacterized protein YbcI
MTVYIANAFSLGMLVKTPTTITVEEIDASSARKIVSAAREKGELVSAIGHEATANLLTIILGEDIAYNRVPIKITDGDAVVVFQLLTRLEEGKVLTAAELWNIKYKFYLVRVEEVKGR